MTEQTPRRILVTGAAGKVGQAFLNRFFLTTPEVPTSVRALCHNRTVPERDGLEVVFGDMSNQEEVRQAMDGVTHVLHLATCKETPDAIMDVAVKGLFWLLESCRTSETFQQFILLGGDAGMGHFFYPFPAPVTETQKHSAYPGCYALSKVLEEVMLEQYYVQYDLNGCCLRAPWIMEKDDFRSTLSFGMDVFGGPRWRDLVSEAQADEYERTQTVPIMLTAEGKPILRNFVHLDDLIEAIFRALAHPKARQQTFNVCMDEPVDYAQVAEYLARTRNLPAVEIKTEFHSTWLDNAKAKFLLGWRPKVDLPALINRAWDYQREPDDPRTIWYPG